MTTSHMGYWLPVTSSNLLAVRYILAKNELYIRFGGPGKKTTEYVYYEVPWDVYNGLMTASSKGTYHHQFIKARFRHLKVA